ncbi:MAG TPA: DUF1580 domain-containing protein [Urbifossiella sp.]|nr:DUF1580 domain-containing protein [Urbifossiella sp.]
MNHPNPHWIPLKLVARAVNPHNPPHSGTVARWVFTGVGRPRVRLETVKIGGRRYTTAAAIKAFITATSGAAASAPRADERREAAIRCAEHRLDAEGVA